MNQEHSCIHVNLTVCGLLWSLLCAPAQANDILPAVDRRFSVDTDETPHFQRHVLPLFRKLGCSGRACHGAASGQGGFRLSLFGYDFQLDHQTLLEGEQPRVDVKQPEASLILQKPTMQVDHGGGEKFKKESWQYRLIESWVRGGAASVEPSDPQFDQLSVTPSEIAATSAKTSHAVKVVCLWSDETQEEVTPLCHFQVLDESVAAIDEQGLVTILGPGDTHLIVFYDNGVASIPIVVRRETQANVEIADDEQATPIDRLIGQKLTKMGIAPSDICSDTEFLRRAALDITGLAPHPDEIKSFIDDQRPDKRAVKIEELLASPGYGSYWSFKLGEIWGNYSRDFPDAVARESQSYHWYRWLASQIATNVPYDKIVEGMVLSQSRLPGESYDQYVDRVRQIYQDNTAYAPAERETMPIFWYRSGLRQPQDAAMAFSHAFVGVRLECAQCHKHPFDTWTNADFRHFANYFTRIKHDYSAEVKGELEGRLAEFKPLRFEDQAKLVREGKPYPYRELIILPPIEPSANRDGAPMRFLQRDLVKVRKEMVEARRAGDQKRFAQAETLLQKLNRARLYQLESLIEKTEKTVKADHPILMQYHKNADAMRREIQGLQTTKILNSIPADPQVVEDPRSILMEWLRSTDNPYFARIFVNRVWASYFGRGIIDPVDDLNLANPPVNKPLLDYLSQGFIEHKYDIKWLHREIANSRAYQRSWKPNETNGDDEKNFSRALPRRIPAEVFDLALKQSLGVASSVPHFPFTLSDFRKRIEHNHLLEVFGRPNTSRLCDCNRSNEPTLMQAVLVQNDDYIQLLQNSPWLKSITDGKPQPPIDEFIEAAYLRTLCRLPTEDELTTCRTHLGEIPNLMFGMQDIMWALLNSKEFWFIH
ncbi:MAG: DUF1549 domain-containing protein [Planctomycetaceae bacterium]